MAGQKWYFRKNIGWIKSLLRKLWIGLLLFILVKKIGLIWDKAGSHVSSDIEQYLTEKGIVFDYIHAGMTSIMQPCDIWANKPFKQRVKGESYAFKNDSDYATGDKITVTREHLVAQLFSIYTNALQCVITLRVSK